MTKCGLYKKYYQHTDAGISYDLLAIYSEVISVACHPYPVSLSL